MCDKNYGYEVLVTFRKAFSQFATVQVANSQMTFILMTSIEVRHLDPNDNLFFADREKIMLMMGLI